MIYCTYVSFTPQDSVAVTPPIQKGKRDSFWVKTNSADSEEIAKAAYRKASKCYGLSIKDVEVNDGMQFTL